MNVEQSNLNQCMEVEAMNEIKVFNSEQFGELRVVSINGEPWFVAADVCRVLEHSNVSVALERLDGDEKAKLNLGLSGGDTNCVNEPGLYALTLGSRKPEAKPFKRWVTHDVLPSIRKTGSYTVPQPKPADSSKAQLAEAKLLNARSRASSMWYKFSELLQTPEHKQLCAAYGTSVLTGGQMVLPLPAAEKTYSASEIAAMYHTSANEIGRIANEHHLKTDQYGHHVMDVAKFTPGKTVSTFRYNEAAVAEIGKHVAKN